MFSLSQSVIICHKISVTSYFGCDIDSQLWLRSLLNIVKYRCDKGITLPNLIFWALVFHLIGILLRNFFYNFILKIILQGHKKTTTYNNVSSRLYFVHWKLQCTVQSVQCTESRVFSIKQVCRVSMNQLLAGWPIFIEIPFQPPLQCTVQYTVQGTVQCTICCTVKCEFQ